MLSDDDVQAWAIDRITFKQVLMSSTLRKRDLYDEFLKNVPILETLTVAERATIADALQPVRALWRCLMTC